jgi:hypothetical protein
MRRLSFLLIFSVAGCGNDNGNNVVKPSQDLSMADDLSMPLNGMDLSVLPDLSPLTPSGMIRAVRTAVDAGNTPDGGMLAMSIPVEDVFVTYLRPEVSGETDDPPGFYVQADMNGPALFVRIDPTTLTPAPKVGDLVRFTVTGASKDAGGTRQATSLMDWTVESSSHSLMSLLQDLSSATDLATAIDNYESELTRINGVVAGPFGSSGAGYVQATLDTAGVPTGAKVKLRLPIGLRDQLDVAQGCTVTVGPTPLGRFNTTVQPSAWVTSDIQLSTCPQMQVVSALATDSTHVAVTFDHFVEPGSLVASGGQFSFDNGLTVDNSGGTGAVLSAPNVVMVTTSSQSGSTVYTVTVGTTLNDLRQALDPAHNTAIFAGFTPPATLIINEYNPNISGSQDLVELLATNGGSVAGFTLYMDFSTAKRQHLADLPTNLVVTTGDFLLVHLNPPASPSPAPTTEFNIGNPSPSPQAQCTFSTCSLTAWDVAANDNQGLSYKSRRLITLVGPNGNVVDAVAYTGESGGSAGNGAELQAAIDGGFWTTACNSSPCADNTTMGLQSSGFDTSAFDLVPSPSPIGTTVAGVSAQRTTSIAHSGKTDWLRKGSTWGKAN